MRIVKNGQHMGEEGGVKPSTSTNGFLPLSYNNIHAILNDTIRVFVVVPFL